jgi:hypothetical protein
MKIIELSQSILSLVTMHPEIKDILFELGFKDIVKPGMLQTVGRIMTLEKGSRMQSIDLEVVKHKLTEKGYTIKE